MKVILLLTLNILFISFLSAQTTLHPWTDLQGRTLEASFIKSDGVTVTINWNGKVVPIPLATLSGESQALATQLSTPSKSANPFDTIATPPSAKKLHSWTDLQGRTLKAIFIKADSSSVTVEWQGKVVPLPLGNLNPESKALAMRLAGKSAPEKEATLPKKVVAKPAPNPFKLNVP